MPQAIGYPVSPIRRSEKNVAAVVRAKSLIADAKTSRSTLRETAWRRSEKQWLGKQWGDVDADVGGDLVTVNMSFSTVNTIVPYVTGSEPNFIIEPYSGQATPQNARLIQAMLNRHWRSNRMAGNAHLKRAAWDNLIYGDGYLKVSYTIDEVFKPGTLDPAEVANLWVDRIDPWDVWMDPQADGLHNARWVALRAFMSVAELKDDKRYSHTKMLSSSSEADDDSGREQRLETTGDDRDAMVAVYEFYDIASRELVVVTDQVELPMQFVEDITSPIVHLPNHPIPHAPYNMGELEQLRGLQRELNKTRTQMVEHRRRNAQKWAVRKGALDPAAKDALQSEEVNAVVEISGSEPIEMTVTSLDVPNLAADIYAVDTTIKADIYEISGVNEYLRGATPEIRRTATEATIIEGASNIKTAHKLRKIEIAARECGQLMLDYSADVFPLTDTDEMSLILTGKEAQAAAVLELQGAEGAPQLQDVASMTVTPSEEMFAGRYEVFVEQGSTELRNPVMREQKYREMYELLANTSPIWMQMQIPVNLRKSMELWFDAAGIDDLDAMFEGQLPPPQVDPNAAPAPDGAPGGEQIPPELLAAMQATGGGGGPPGPPTDVLGPENTGAFPPTA